MSARGALATKPMMVEEGRTPGPARLTVARADDRTLRECAESAVRRYFADLGDTEPREVYDLVLAEIEQPLLRVVLEHTRGNQSKAAELLGINRSTLRKKLRRHGLHN
jgi:Fis family transcriptional regulator